MEVERTRRKVSAKDGTVTQLDPCYSHIKACRACGVAQLEMVLDLGEQYLPRFPKEVDFALPKAPLVLGRCRSCGLLQLLHSVDKDLLFREYWYRSSINQTMKDALNDLVLDGLKRHKQGTWLDIGANDGTLLKAVPNDFHKIACEPAKNLKEELEGAADEVISDYFDARLVSQKCDVVTSAAMFYDLDEPAKFVEGVARTLNHNGVWINQLNEASAMLRNNAWDGICHEHACYYDLVSLNRLYMRAGLTIIDVSHNDINGGSIRVTARKWGDDTDLLGHNRVSEHEVECFAKRTLRWREQMREVLSLPSVGNSVWAYAASTKGTVMLQFLGDSPILAVADRNPAKIGRYMVGSWLPIVSEAELRRQKPRYIVPLAWAFRDEFIAREKALRDLGSTLLFPLPHIEFVT